MPVPDSFWYAGLLWQLDFSAAAGCWVISTPGHRIAWSAVERPVWPHTPLANAPVEQAKAHIYQAGCGARACGCKLPI